MKNHALKRNIIAAIILTALLVIFNIVKHNTQIISFYTQNISSPLAAFIGAACGLLPFSVAEVVWTAFVIFAVLYIIFAVIKIVKSKGKRGYAVLQKLSGMCVIALSVATGFTALWGVNYYAETFEQKSGLVDSPISVEQLADVTRLFATKLNDAALSVNRDENGVCASDVDAMLKASKDLYAPLEEEYPFLQTPHRAAKPMVYSQLMSAINYTGFYFPFTGEANINVAQPNAYIGATIAHEQAHLRGVAQEQTANFLAILACEKTEDVNFRYSGAILAYTHLTNALYSADYKQWLEVANSLCDEVNLDLTVNSAYWQQRNTSVSAAANTVYEGFLKSYDQKQGLKSYGEVVDLLVEYYAMQA
ncbi:MAG: DUF3810 domain-containing protein [Clostridia bacterium]|jgi:hypothetical protein|nr:DUF3810 domain-containing protein [Clostridia bacterium]NLS86106.1 DUF3810 domain-containing protein [Oscillospiraceae bacterium]